MGEKAEEKHTSNVFTTGGGVGVFLEDVTTDVLQREGTDECAIDRTISSTNSSTR